MTSLTTTSYESDPRYPNNAPPSTINQDLANERANTPFNPTSITNFIDGSVDITNRRRQLESWIIRDPTGVSFIVYMLNVYLTHMYNLCNVLFLICELMLMFCLISTSCVNN